MPARRLFRATSKTLCAFTPCAIGTRLWLCHPKANCPLQRAWPRGSIDQFIFSSLQQQNQTPSIDAEPAALFRRLHYDLIGLPPSQEALGRWLAEPSEEVYAQIVNDFLSRPEFGERWGLHWLDVVCYADSNDADRNYTYHHAWRYRNYVIYCFNRGRPFYQFVQQQLAGDLMPYERMGQRYYQLVAWSTSLQLALTLLRQKYSAQKSSGA